ncbi:MAG: hypothetical protein LV481_13595 [Methylacidiphilales bacterium]|nr:hypothetical protein [Candidatus Methylacidiphilales bacterium]
MKSRVVLIAVGLFLFFVPAAWAHVPHVWSVTSPDHGQTFAYGSESHRAWSSRGKTPHLLLYLDYTNDPYVNEDYPRLQDSFSFDFPNVKLQSDGRTFAYHAPDGRVLPVARRSPGFLGFEEIKLLPNSELIIEKPHGYLTLTLLIEG